MQKITPFLWFDTQAEEAAEFYVSIFRNSRITQVTHYSEPVAAASGRQEGAVMTVSFELDGQHFTALNGGPQFRFTEAISLMVTVEDQDELDRVWEKLTDGGEEVQCGWLKDRFGLSWQIVPSAFWRLMDDPDPARRERVMTALMGMVKIDVSGLEKAADLPSHS